MRPQLLKISNPPTFEVVVVVYRSGHVLREFLAHVGIDVPVILVDNSSCDEDLSGLLDPYSNITYIDSGENLGFSVAANMGAKASTADYLIFMNPDTSPTPESLRLLVNYLAEHPEVASCGATGVGTTGGGAQPTAPRVLAHSLGLHRLLPLSGVFFAPRQGRRLAAGWISGSCLAIRRSAFEAVGGFDPAYYVYMSDFDLGRRLGAAGFQQVLMGDVVVPHADGGSSDLPSTWTWEHRGRAWTRYLRRTRRAPAAIGVSALLVAGYTVRIVFYTVTGRSSRVREMWAYARSAIAEWSHDTDPRPSLSPDSHP